MFNPKQKHVNKTRIWHHYFSQISYKTSHEINTRLQIATHVKTHICMARIHVCVSYAVNAFLQFSVSKSDKSKYLNI